MKERCRLIKLGIAWNLHSTTSLPYRPATEGYVPTDFFLLEEPFIFLTKLLFLSNLET